MKEQSSSHINYEVPGYENVDIYIPSEWPTEKRMEYLQKNFPPKPPKTTKDTEQSFTKFDPAPPPPRNEAPPPPKDNTDYPDDGFLWPLSSWAFYKDTASKFWGKNLAGIIAKSGAGVARGLTLGVIDLEKGTVGVPFTDKKYQFQMPLDEALAQWGVDSDLAENEWVGVAPDFIASMAPFTPLLRGTQWLSRAIRGGAKAAPVAVASGKAALGIRTAETTAAATAEGMFRPRSEDESMLQRFALSAGLGAAGHLVLAEGVAHLARKGQLKSIQKLDEQITKWLQSEKGFSPEDAQKLWGINKAEFLAQNGNDLVLLKDRATQTTRAMQANVVDDFSPKPGGLAQRMQNAEALQQAEQATARRTADARAAWHMRKSLDDMTPQQREAHWDAELASGKGIPDSELANHPALQKKYKLEPQGVGYSERELHDFVSDIVRISDNGLYRNALPTSDSGEILKLARRINLNRIRTTEDAMRFIMASEFIDPQALDRAAGGIIPHRATRAQAQQYIKELARDTGVAEQALQGLANDLHNVGKKATAFRSLLVASAEEGDKLLKAAKLAEAADQVLDAEVLYLKFAAHTQRHNSFTQLTQKVQTELARGLNSFQIKVGAANIDFDQITGDMLSKNPELRKQFERAFQKVGGSSKVLDLGNQWSRGGNLAAKTKVAKGLDEHWVLNVLVEMRKGNVIGNVGRPIVETADLYAKWALGLGQGGIPLAEANARTRAVWGTALNFAVVRPINAAYKGSMNLSKAPKVLQEYWKTHSILDMGLDALHALPRLEQRIDRLGKDPFMIKEGAANKALSSEYLKDKFIFKYITALANKMDKGGTLDEAMWAAFDTAASAFRMPSYALLKLGDVPFETMAYEGELAGRLHKLARGMKYEGAKFTNFKDSLALHVQNYNQGKPLKVTPDAIRWVKDTPQYQKALLDSGEALQKGLKNEFDVRFDTFRSIIKELDDESIKVSREWTWKGDRPGFLGKIEGAMNTPGGKVAQLVPGVPLFIKTPARLIEYTLQKTPGINLLFKETGIKALFSGDVNVRSTAWAKQLVGTTIFASLYALYNEGSLIGKIGVDERHVATALGARQYSMRLPYTDDWVNFAYIEPFGTAAGMVTDFLNFQKEHEHDPEFWFRLTGAKPGDASSEELASAFMMSMFHSLANNIASKSWLKESGEAWEAMNSTEKGPKRIAGMAVTYARSFAPLSGFFGSKTKVFDDSSMEHQRNFKEMLAATYGEGRPAIDIFGKPLPIHKPWMIGLDPSRLRIESPIRVKMFQLGMAVPKPPQEFQGMHISNEDYDAILRLMDTEFALEDRLNEIIPSLEETPVPVQHEFVQSMFNTAWTLSSLHYFRERQEGGKDRG